MVTPDNGPKPSDADLQPAIPGVGVDRLEGAEQDLGEMAARSAAVKLSQPSEPDEDNPQAKYYMGPGRDTGTTEPPRVRGPQRKHTNRRGGRSYSEPGGRDAADIEARADYKRRVVAGEISQRKLNLQPEVQKELGEVEGHWRAGFIPKTRSELKEVKALLAHIGNPMQRKGGVHDHLRKLADGEKARIAHSQEGSSGKGRAVRSRLFEYTDYLAGAQRSVTALRALKSVIEAQTSPGLSLADLAEAHPGISGLPELLQYMDGLDVFVKGGSVAPFNQWVARRNEDIGAQARGQNKRLEDAYTGSGQTVQEHTYIAERFGEIKAMNVAATVRDAIENARREENFWTYVLEDAGFEFTQVRDDVTAAVQARDDSSNV